MARPAITWARVRAVLEAAHEDGAPSAYWIGWDDYGEPVLKENNGWTVARTPRAAAVVVWSSLDEPPALRARMAELLGERVAA